MSIQANRAQRRELERENASRPSYLVEVPRTEWPEALLFADRGPVMVWRSRNFLVQKFEDYKGSALCRLSICRTNVQGNEWKDGITWEELQILKAQCGYGDDWAVEVFPADLHVVNVANMRHLWILPSMPDFAWGKQGS